MQKARLEITFIIAESSLELVPIAIADHPDIVRHARKRKKKPYEIILDMTYHYRAILSSNIPQKHKRGRPDIVHRAILLALDSLLNKLGFLRLYLHTIDDKIIWISPNARIPRHYNRFIGLMEKLLSIGKIIANTEKGEETLLEILPISLENLLDNLRPNIVIGFSKRGKIKEGLLEYLSTLIQRNIDKNRYVNIVNIIGGFPHGTFSQRVLKIVDELISISKYSLSTQYTLCKVISCYESILRLVP
ncbi:MAG: 16S rRNA methyltransferase [Thermoprotei archaeon]|nr:MAG: 16S rRNA methyltransferase [Thermoprotei archaeon]